MIAQGSLIRQPAPSVDAGLRQQNRQLQAAYSRLLDEGIVLVKECSMWRTRALMAEQQVGDLVAENERLLARTTRLLARQRGRPALWVVGQEGA